VTLPPLTDPTVRIARIEWARAHLMRISRKEGQRFTACRSMVSRHVGPVLMKQDVLNCLSETNIRQ
jgi:hypothetical protein